MIFNLIGLIIGIMILGAGIYYLVKEMLMNAYKL